MSPGNKIIQIIRAVETMITETPEGQARNLLAEANKLLRVARIEMAQIPAACRKFERSEKNPHLCITCGQLEGRHG